VVKQQVPRQAKAGVGRQQTSRFKEKGKKADVIREACKVTLVTHRSEATAIVVAADARENPRARALAAFLMPAQADE
jgi:hypothetical protein